MDKRWMGNVNSGACKTLCSLVLSAIGFIMSITDVKFLKKGFY